MRYDIEPDTYGYWVVDTIIDDGEDWVVSGYWTYAEAKTACDTLVSCGHAANASHIAEDASRQADDAN